MAHRSVERRVVTATATATATRTEVRPAPVSANNTVSYHAATDPSPSPSPFTKRESPAASRRQREAITDQRRREVRSQSFVLSLWIKCGL